MIIPVLPQFSKSCWQTFMQSISFIISVLSVSIFVPNITFEHIILLILFIKSLPILLIFQRNSFDSIIMVLNVRHVNVKIHQVD